MKYYAVKQGRKTGIFETWTEAEQQVKGFSNAKYKSFSSKFDAEEYLDNQNTSDKMIYTNYEAYVDGSFNKSSNTYGSGVVIVSEQNVIQEFSFSGKNQDYVDSFQIAGEVFAAIRALEWAIENKIGDLTIYYDYEGIRSWAVGEWNTNKPVSRDYKIKFDTLSKKVRIYFKKVKAHSGVEFNELADKLAKKATKGVEFSAEELSQELNLYQ